MFKASQFDKLLEKATSPRSLEPVLADILQLCDLIRSGDQPPKQAVLAIKKRLGNTNPHVVHHTLQVLDCMMKNCGHVVHDEVATKPFMETIRETLKSSENENVQHKILELLQSWAHVFRSTPKYKVVPDMVASLKSEGLKFPDMEESDAMFTADSAPEWQKATECHHCRNTFQLFRRRHHCRNCGNTFCGDCANKFISLPKIGIEKEVRVCDECYEKVTSSRAISPGSKVETETLPAEYVKSSLANQPQGPKKLTSEEVAEREEMELALALSKSEAEAKDREKKRATAEILSAAQRNRASISASATTSTAKEEDDDPEMARYLNRSYWEQRERKNDHGRSTSPDRYRMSPPSAPESPKHKQNGVDGAEMDEFVSSLRGQLDMFVNRMKSNSSRGRSISTDSSVQTLFLNVTSQHSRLLEYIQQQDDLRVYYEGLQDKLAQVKDAMAALEDLREEHKEKLRREAEEAERLKQLQMAQKLQIMRKKKQESLEHQRLVAIQRIQEQEREMQMRKEHQKQQYLMGAAMPQYMMSPYQPNYGPASVPGGPPMMITNAAYPPQSYQPMQPGGFPPGMPPPSMPPHLPHMGPGVPPNIPPNMQPQVGVPYNPAVPLQHMPQGPHYSGLPPPMVPPGIEQVPPAAIAPMSQNDLAMQQQLPPWMANHQMPPYPGMVPQQQPPMGAPPPIQPSATQPGAPQLTELPTQDQQGHQGQPPNQNTPTAELIRFD